MARLQRIGPRPVFVAGECEDATGQAMRFLKASGIDLANFTVRGLGFTDHSSVWGLRPDPMGTRNELRAWVGKALGVTMPVTPPPTRTPPTLPPPTLPPTLPPTPPTPPLDMVLEFSPNSTWEGVDYPGICVRHKLEVGPDSMPIAWYDRNTSTTRFLMSNHRTRCLGPTFTILTA